MAKHVLHTCAIEPIMPRARTKPQQHDSASHAQAHGKHAARAQIEIHTPTIQQCLVFWHGEGRRNADRCSIPPSTCERGCGPREHT
eukprot:3277716-Pyramimonas_sp.AAC.1